MKTNPLFIAFAFVITGCDVRNTSSNSTVAGSAERMKEEFEYEVSDNYGGNLSRLAESFDVPVADIIKCGYGTSLDMGSHRWIYRWDELGRFKYAILFRWSDHDQDTFDPSPELVVNGKVRTLNVFRETIENATLRRIELRDDEIVTELESISNYLREFLGNDMYEFYYQGGQPQQPESEVEQQAETDPFAYKLPRTKEQLRQQLVLMNHSTAAATAQLIRDYRMITKK